MPGNVFVPATASGLSRDSVVDVTGIVTLNKEDLSDHIGDLPGYLEVEVERGLRTVLDLEHRLRNRVARWTPVSGRRQPAVGACTGNGAG